jgi:predicted amidohydrolase/ribosomal protein S18 acetylase RimI-like enzyme
MKSRASGVLAGRDFVKKIKVRRLRVSDFDELVELQLKCFPGMTPWLKAQIESQVRIFPEGQICIEYKGRLVASSSSLVVSSSGYSAWHNWKETADNGYIRNHDPRGDILYGIEIMVHPEFRGMKLARRLYEARKRLAAEMNLARIVIGGRLSGYGAHADKMTVREYVEKVMDKVLVDPVLTPQLANGFVLKGIIPDYFPSDSESRGYATYLEWTNLDYVLKGKRRYTVPSSPVRLCAVQYEMRQISDFSGFAEQCEFFVDVASDHRSDFVVFPELFSTQLLSFLGPQRPGLAARRLARFMPRQLELFTGLAVKYNINIVGGSHFTVEDGKLRNSAYLFRRNGSLARQDKLHITPNERRWWGLSPGERLEIFDTDRGKVAIAICYDIEFPELARIAAAKGAQILFVPFNTDERHGYLRVRHCAQARCIENHLYTVIAGCVGNLPDVENVDLHYAQSAILSPSDLEFGRDGVVAECMPNIETVVIHDVDLELLRRQRQSGTVQNWNDRRTDLYKLVYFQGKTAVEL